MAQSTKDKRVAAEIKRLNAIFTELSAAQKGIVEGLVKRAAWARVQLEDLERDLDENGWTEKFQQSASVDPYDRERIQAKEYHALVKGYNQTTKMLTEYVSKSVPTGQSEDGLEAFISSK